jgi:[acyl-carrier-protein] S-malonyltransferase
LSNRDGAVVTSGTDWVDRIAHQVANPVRWDRCMATMADLGVTAFIELVPGGTLTGIAKRALPGVELLAIKTPDQLDAARALIAAHRASADAGGTDDNGTAEGNGATGHNGLEPKEA